MLLRRGPLQPYLQVWVVHRDVRLEFARVSLRRGVVVGSESIALVQLTCRAASDDNVPFSVHVERSERHRLSG